MQYVTSVERDTLFAISSAVTHPTLRRRARLLAAGLALARRCSPVAAAAAARRSSRSPGGSGTPPTQSYTGPAPNTADVQSFKINLWDNIRRARIAAARATASTGGQTPMFARSDDVNLAYAAANSVVDARPRRRTR